MQFIKTAFIVGSWLVARSVAAQPAPEPEPPAPPTPGPEPFGPPTQPGPPPAQPAPPPAQPASVAPSQPVLPGVLSTAVGGILDGRIDYTHFDFGEGSTPTLLAFNLHGQYIAPNGAGGYVSLPVTFISADSDSETYAGNLELGGLYVLRQGNTDGYFRAGLAVNTSSDEGSIVAPIVNLVSRPADAFTTGLNTNWLRGGAGVRLTSGALVLGGSGGLDYPFDSGDEGWSALLHLTGSIGVAQPGFGLAVGVTMLQVLEDSSDGGGDENFFGFQAVGDVVAGGSARVYGALGLNLEGSDTAYSIGAGVRVGF